MGTRGAWGFVSNGTEYLTYNHYDSYPEALGTDILCFMRGQTGDLDGLRNRVEALQSVDAQAEPSEDERVKLADFADTGVSTGKDWYSLLRETQGNPELTLAAGYMPEGGGDFARNNSLFCEWAYVVDLDAGFFEVYKGFQTEPHTEGRFADGEPRKGYYPCKMIAAYSIHELPTDEQFLEDCSPPDEDESDTLAA